MKEETPHTVTVTRRPSSSTPRSQHPITQHPSSPPSTTHKPNPTELSVIPGETEEDGLLRREYVLVGDTRALEFNKAVDEINAARRRTGPLVDRHGHGLPHTGMVSTAPTPLELEHAPLEPDYFAATKDTTVPRRSDSPDMMMPASPITSPTLTSPPMSTGAGATRFPPVPNSPGSAPPVLSRSPSNALSRALTLASKRLFGVGHTVVPSVVSAAGASSPLSTSPSTVGRFGAGNGAVGNGNGAMATAGNGIMGNGITNAATLNDPLENELLAALEQLAQKTDVITRWADEMYEFVKAVPQSTFTPILSYLRLLTNSIQ
jgi:serine/threonine-protein kinase ULK2